MGVPALRRKSFRHPPAWESPIKSPVWAEFARSYGEIAYVLPYNQAKHYLELGHFASVNGMAINVGYFARIDPQPELRARQKLAQEVSSRQFRPRTLYIFEDDALWQVSVR